MEKTFNQKNFNNFVLTPLGSRVAFCSLILLALFAAGVVDTGGNLPPASLTTVANLPPVSTTLAKMVEKFATGVTDTGGKFATGVIDTGGAP
jgi:hypothetical protein